MPRRHFLAVGAIVAAFVVSQLRAATDAGRLTLERIFSGSEFALGSVGPLHWVQNGAAYLRPEPAADGSGGSDIVLTHTGDGARDVLAPAARLNVPGTDRGLVVSGVQLSPDGRHVLIFTNAQRVWRERTRGDYWLLDSKTGRLRQLGADAPSASLMFAKFSSDGTRVAYVRENNIHIEPVGGGAPKAVTTDGSKRIINGTFDWVYEEELNLRDGFRWSPDGKTIAYWQLDTTGVRDFILVDNTSDIYSRITAIPWPKVGTINSAARIGFVSADGSRTRWAKLDGDPREHYLAAMTWTPSGDALLVQRLNRRQNVNQILLVDPRSGDMNEVLTETDEAWLRAVDNVRWTNSGAEFIWTSERNGWRQAFAVTRQGASRPLTPSGVDVEELAGLDESRGWLYYTASPDDPLRRYLYRVPLAEHAPPIRVTPELASGWHGYNISPSGEWALHTSSSFDSPPETKVINLPGHQPVRTVVDNQKARGAVASLQRTPPEFFRIDVGGGVQLDAWLMKPPGFDPTVRYPLLIYVYGEPAAQTVVDRWGGERYLWHVMLTQQGYLVASIDNRGTPAPRGRAWRKAIYRRIGVLAPAEQAAAARALAARPYVDAARIGIWGWSSGGTMSLHAIFKHPDLYRMAMAVAPLVDLRFYNTIYQERYMGLLEDNREGYTAGSAITHVDGLRGDLLVVHGSGDDNVHVQGTEALVNALVERNKPFTMMVYPNRTHSITEGRNTRRHVYELLTRFLRNHLPVNPIGS